MTGPKVYVVVDVGCRECGEASHVLKVTSDRSSAEAAWKELTGSETVDVFDTDMGSEWDQVPGLIALRSSTAYARMLCELPLE